MKFHDLKKVLALSLGILLVASFSLVNFSGYKIVRAADEEAEIDEEAVDETEDKIEDIEKDIKDEQKDVEKFSQELQVIQGNIGRIASQINSTETELEKTENEIERTELEIKAIKERIELQKEILSFYLQDLYYLNEEGMPEFLLTGKSFLDVFGESDNLEMMSEKIHQINKEMEDDKAQYAQEKENLDTKKAEHEELLGVREAQQNELLAEKAKTQADIQEKEATIGELRGKLVELQADLTILTGVAYSAKDIREAVEYASKKTDVPKGVLYGFLKMETNLGANTGQCTYKEVKKVALDRYEDLLKDNKKWQASIDLLEKRYDIFKDIVKELGYSKNKKVSCTPTSYIGQGGAMGVAQFMSDVWRGYESSITAKTGHKNPDPWDLTDGVMAMALKLEKAGATSDSKSAIKKASINYLGSFNQGYYDGIVYWSKNYKRLFE